MSLFGTLPSDVVVFGAGGAPEPEGGDMGGGVPEVSCGGSPGVGAAGPLLAVPAVGCWLP